ncbi:MAG: transcriptional regulator [Proteobacteria bacterium]|nr:transcriptional regulator [Pseudomonadota bacterium]
MASGYSQFCPVAVASEVFAQRWTPIILRELFAGARHFNEIHRGIPLISRALLAQRLRCLEAAGVVARQALPGRLGHCYALTDCGREFAPVIEQLGNWGQRWTVRVTPDNLDAGLLMWNLRRRIALDRLPARRTVVRFKFHGVPVRLRGPRVFWLLLDRRHVDLCISDPGSEVDLYVEADLAAFTRVWLGDATLEQARRSGELQLSGPRELLGAFPTWLLLSRFAGVSRPRPTPLGPNDSMRLSP